MADDLASQQPSLPAGNPAEKSPSPGGTSSLETKGPEPSENPSWQRVQLARHPKRPQTLNYIDGLLTNFQELHGDRFFGDDKSIIGGMGLFDGRPVMLIGQQKGRD